MSYWAKTLDVHALNFLFLERKRKVYIYSPIAGGRSAWEGVAGGNRE
jgi:hypothetical protein